VVVDPGVGGIRRPIVAQVGGQRFVAPDNGVLSHVLTTAAGWRVWAVTEPAFVRTPASLTFHGRDVFAPVAGMLAAGSSPESFGPEVSDPAILPLPRVVAGRDRLRGEVVWVDHFGNCLTNITQSDLEGLAARARTGLEVRVGNHRITGIVSRFEEASGAGGGALVGSMRRLELFLDRGNLAADWGIVPGTEVVVLASEEAGEEGGSGRIGADAGYHEDLA
jgi:S-adenosylmethionine hydrolase